MPHRNRLVRFGCMSAVALLAFAVPAQAEVITLTVASFTLDIDTTNGTVFYAGGGKQWLSPLWSDGRPDRRPLHNLAGIAAHFAARSSHWCADRPPRHFCGHEMPEGIRRYLTLIGLTRGMRKPGSFRCATLLVLPLGSLSIERPILPPSMSASPRPL